eukprot:30797-Pelagococcus_subviridis.AAC.4
MERRAPPAVHVRVERAPERQRLELRLLQDRARELELVRVVGREDRRDDALVAQRGPLIRPVFLRHPFQTCGRGVVEDVLPEDVHHHARHEVELLFRRRPVAVVVGRARD